MKLSLAETVVNCEFSVAARPLSSLPFAVILYWVPRSTLPVGFQERPSAASAPGTALPPCASVIVTSESLPPSALTVTSLMEALVEPSFAEMVIFSVEASLAAAASDALAVLAVVAGLGVAAAGGQRERADQQAGRSRDQPDAAPGMRTRGARGAELLRLRCVVRRRRCHGLLHVCVMYCEIKSSTCIEHPNGPMVAGIECDGGHIRGGSGPQLPYRSP